MRKKQRKRYIPIPKSLKILQKQIRKAIAKKNRRYHHRNQRWGQETEKKTFFKIKFNENLYLSDKKEQVFAKINSAKDVTDVSFSFSDVKKVDVGSMLYIKAFVDYKKALGHTVKISCSETNTKMRQILQHMKLRDYNLGVTFSDIKCWTVKEWYGNAKDNYGKVLMQEILPTVLEGKFPSSEFSRIASGLHELLANCSEHAYTEDCNFKGYYLIAGEYENTSIGKSNEFSFCIIDMGQGFRSSLHKNSVFQNVISTFGISSDEYLIEAAVKGKFNADTTKTKGRGTGLPAVRKSVEMVKGSLHIYSDAGTYLFNNNIERVKKRTNDIIGSIITVSLPIN